MSFPLVMSASKPKLLPTISVPNIRGNYTQEEYLPTEPYFVVSTGNPGNTSKIHKHKRPKTVKKSKKKRRSKHSHNSTVRLTDCEAALDFYSVANGKNRRETADKNSLNATKNQDPRRAPSIVFCTVKKLISSYSSNKRSPKPKPMQPKVSECSPRTPQTGISKPPRVVKTQICPPLQQSHSPTRRKTRIRKVYYSEAQSQMRAGIPCAPPATPLNDILIAMEIVPCMADIKSQQAIKAKLKNIEIQRQKANEKIRDRFLKDEKKREKQEKESIRQQRRAEIYALNKIMTELEHNKFLQCMKEKNKGKTTISLNV